MRAVSQVIQRLQLLGIHAHRFEMDSSQGCQLQAFGFAEFIQIWFVLEEVCIEALICKGQVRLDIIGEFDHFDLDSFFGEFVFHNADDFSVRYRGYADLDGGFFGSFRRSRGYGFLITAACDDASSREDCSRYEDGFFEVHRDPSRRKKRGTAMRRTHMKYSFIYSTSERAASRGNQGSGFRVQG